MFRPRDPDVSHVTGEHDHIALSERHDIAFNAIAAQLARERRQAKWQGTVRLVADIIGGTATLILAVCALWAVAHWPHH